MGTLPTPGPTHHQSWHDLYLQALFETNKSKLPRSIAEAERALLIREHELFTGRQDPIEREAVNAALHALQALKSCMGINAAGAAA